MNSQRFVIFEARPAQAVSNLHAIISRLTQAGHKVFLVTMTDGEDNPRNGLTRLYSRNFSQLSFGHRPLQSQEDWHQFNGLTVDQVVESMVSVAGAANLWLLPLGEFEELDGMLRACSEHHLRGMPMAFYPLFPATIDLIKEKEVCQEQHLTVYDSIPLKREELEAKVDALATYYPGWYRLYSRLVGNYGVAFLSTETLYVRS